MTTDPPPKRRNIIIILLSRVVCRAFIIFTVKKTAVRRQHPYRFVQDKTKVRMSRRKQSRPVKVLEDGSDEERSDGFVPRRKQPGAVVINGHHVSTSTRRFDDGKSTLLFFLYLLYRSTSVYVCIPGFLYRRRLCIGLTFGGNARNAYRI